MTVSKTARGRAALVGREESAPHRLVREGSRGDQRFPEWVGGALGGDQQDGSCGFRAAVLTLAATFFFDFPAAG